MLEEFFEKYPDITDKEIQTYRKRFEEEKDMRRKQYEEAEERQAEEKAEQDKLLKKLKTGW
jgi:hypothetical protein